MTQHEAFDLYEQNFRTAEALREHIANTDPANLPRFLELAIQAHLLRDQALHAILHENLAINEVLMADFAHAQADSEEVLDRLIHGGEAVGAVSAVFFTVLDKGNQALAGDSPTLPWPRR